MAAGVARCHRRYSFEVFEDGLDAPKTSPARTAVCWLFSEAICASLAGAGKGSFGDSGDREPRARTAFHPTTPKITATAILRPINGLFIVQLLKPSILVYSVYGGLDAERLLPD